jgi:uncharacterized protein (TIGR03118 family)
VIGRRPAGRKETAMRRRGIASGGALATALLMSIGLAPGAAAQATGYTVTNLVSDQAGVAATQDSHLVNAWGLAAGPTTFWWTANNGTDTASLFDGSGIPQSLVVKVKGAPTGLVFNGGTGFMISDGTTSAASLFLFDTESGTIRGWSPTVGTTTPPSTRTFKVVDRSRADAIYKGLAIASTADGDFLYATDFHNARVDVFDETFHRVRMPRAFKDPDIPSGFAPFGIQNLGGNIFVTYAMQDAAAEDDVAGRHLGYVDMYSTDGTLLERVASRGRLNAPWGLVLAPDSFGPVGGDLLVGNFGNGKINAFDISVMGSPAFDATLEDASSSPIKIDGLWGLGFGNDANAGPSTTLFFTAGPDDESHGLFGSIEASA